MQYEKYFSIYSSDDVAFRKKDRKREKDGGRKGCVSKDIKSFLNF